MRVDGGSGFRERGGGDLLNSEEENWRDCGALWMLSGRSLSGGPKGEGEGLELVLTEEEVELRASCGIQIHRRGDCS